MFDYKFHANTDALELVRKLPKDILEAFHILTIDRCGDDPQSYMRNENYLGHIAQNVHYRLFEDHIEETTDDVTPMAEPKEPKYMVLKGEWCKTISSENDEANILGGQGKYIIPSGEKTIEVPAQIATPELLAYYSCQMVKFGEVFRSTVKENLPLTIVSIGENYEEGFLMNPNFGNGAYLETHDRPHFHMPLDENTGGQLLLGREIDGEKRISGFKIPYGYGILMEPHCIHSDAYLIGRHIVVYSKTEAFSCVIVHQENDELGKINFYDVQ